MNYDVVTVGSALIDAILSLDSKSMYVHLNKAEKELRIASGQKIPVDSCGVFPGGNACNVAVGLARAGLKTGLVAQVADDEFALHILNTLKREHVSPEFLLKHQGSTVLNVALNFKGDRTLFTHHLQSRHDFQIEKVTTRALYLTSLGHEWKSVYTSVAQYVQREKALLAFNPGTTQLSEGVNSFAYLLPLTTVLFVNKEEAEIICGEKGSATQLLTRLKSMGPQIVSITHGELGAFAIDQRGSIYQKDIKICPVIERTGAGDAYASGFLAAYLHGEEIEQSMNWGMHNSASVIGQNGAQAGLLTQKELRECI